MPFELRVGGVPPEEIQGAVENLSKTIDSLFRPPSFAAPHFVRLNLRRQIAVNDDLPKVAVKSSRSVTGLRVRVENRSFPERSVLAARPFEFSECLVEVLFAIE